MFVRGIALILALCGGLAACAKDDHPADGEAVAAVAKAAPATVAGETIQTSPASAVAAMPAGHGAHAFAGLADRGELLDYRANVVRHDGAYTWHRTDLSEAYALRAIAERRLRVTTPDGRILDFQYDRHIEHPSGDWTWIGHLPGADGAMAVLTFGAKAAFGSIAQPGKRPLRLTVRDGASWLVETDPSMLVGIASHAAHPLKPDYHIVRRAALPRAGMVSAAAAPVAAGAGPVTASAATVSAANTVDLVLGYTPGFATANGGNSGAVTRLNHLVDLTNTAYANSQVGARVRLVHAMAVSYTETNTNDTALEQLSGYQSGTGPVTPNAAFNALRAARETYGADLVSLVRKFQDPEQDSCGLAWLLGGAKQGIQANAGWDDLGYSVVGDGQDLGSDGKTYYCEEHTLAHELGHNMGSAHDRVTAQGDDGVLNDPDDYGVYQYSFGFKSTGIAGNFYTIMAYGDSGQTSYLVFSNPRITFCGGHACGTTTYEDNARSLSQTMPIVATFRAMVVPLASATLKDYNGDGHSDVLWRNSDTGADGIWRSANLGTAQTVATVADQRWVIEGAGDFDGDGVSDVLWRHSSTGSNAIWRSANSATPLAMTGVTNLAWKIVGVGDFNGDGRSDVLWRNSSTGSNAIWNSASSGSVQSITSVVDQHWKVVGVGDFDGDGKSDILWRNDSNGSDVIWKSGSSAASQAVTAVTSLAWRIVGVGDVNGDGKADIVWRNVSSGANTIWRSGNSATPQPVTGVTSLAWIIADVADYNGDGKSDLFWRNLQSGANVVWLSANSATPQSVASVSLSWHVSG